MPADFTPDDLHEVCRAELPGDSPPLMSEVTEIGPATRIDLDAQDVAVDLSGRSFGWSCNCGGDSLSLLKGTTADYTVRCGCGRTFRVRIEEVRP